MMLFKLSLRNIKKSLRDYIIYFATLILGVAIFYIFNSLGDQTVMLNISSDTREIVNYLMDVMSVVSVFVAFVLGFLVVYANTFLMKRRKKEFGIYMLLGMSKRKISGILIVETIIIGAISLVAGLLAGIAFSQGMSIVVADLFDADMTSFQFRVSNDAIYKTLLYFVIMYIIVIILDVFVVGKSRLISLIQSGKRSQKNYARNPVLSFIVFVIAWVLLGTAYYNVTAGATSMESFADIGIQVAKGIVGTFLCFWSLSGLIIFIVKKSKRFYFKGLNSFSTKELSSRVNTMVFSGGIICLLLFFTICIMSSAVSMKRSMDENLRQKVPMDIEFYAYGGILKYIEDIEGMDLQKILEDRGVPMDELKDITTITAYQGSDLTEIELLGSQIEEYDLTEEEKELYYGLQIPVVRLSDYNRFVAAFNGKTYTLDGDSYIVLSDYSFVEDTFNDALKEGNVIDLGGRQYRPQYSSCQDGFIEMSSTASTFGIVLVPDDADLSDMTYGVMYLAANYIEKDKEAKRDLDKRIGELDLMIEVDEAEIEKYAGVYVVTEAADTEYRVYIDYVTKNYLYDTSIGMTAMIIFVGVYLGIVFLISSGAILALKELSEAADNKEKYQILRRIGVDEKQISRSLFAQCGIFFGIPLLIGIIHSVFGMQTAMYILNVFGKNGLLVSILIAGVVIIAIYGIYFWITYACSRKIISE